MTWVDLTKYGLIITAVAVVVWLWRDGYWRDKIANAPVQRDTVVVRETVPPIVIEAPARTVRDTVLISPDWNKDSLISEWSKIATLDTTVVHDLDTVHVNVNYRPIMKRFAVSVNLAPRKHTIITDTKMVYSEPEWWQYAALGVSSGLTAWGIANEDSWLFLGGAAGLTVSILTL